MSTIFDPWNLQMKQSNDEGIHSAALYDADGMLLAESSDFQLPKEGTEIPPVLAAMLLTVQAPKLLAACEQALLWIPEEYKGAREILTGALGHPRPVANKPSPYRYEQSTDGCCDTFDIIGPDDNRLVSVHCWAERDIADAEARARLIVDALNAYTSVATSNTTE